MKSRSGGSCREAHFVGRAPESGARLFRLTTFPCVSFNIYFETAYMDAASRYLFFARQFHPTGETEIWRGDLTNLSVTRVDSSLSGARGCAMASDLSAFYYLRPEPKGPVLCAVDSVTLEPRIEQPLPGLPHPTTLGTIDVAGGRYLFGSQANGYGMLYAVETGSGVWKPVLEGDCYPNSHLQLNPANPDQLLVQINRMTPGAVAAGGGTHLCSSLITLGIFSFSEQTVTELPVCPPHTQADCQGHQCFIGATGRVLLTLRDRHPDGPSDAEAGPDQLVSVGLGEARPTVVSAAHRFRHANASRNGRFFVSDTAEGALVVGSLATGRVALLCQTGSSFCSAQYTHPHPYFSPDSRWVVYNSDQSGIPQIYLAELPGGLLESLEYP